MAPNEAAEGHCIWLYRLIKLVPVLFIVTIIFWSYYAYVLELCLFTVTSSTQRIIYLILFHCILFIFLWAYWKTVFTPTGRVPDQFKLPDGVHDRLIQAEDNNIMQAILLHFSMHLPNVTFTPNGGIRYCEKCKLIKPDRAHHCSVCGYCVLKMDHHCPWVNNCISFTNYKFFILFMAYGFIYCSFVVATTLEYFILFWKGHLSSGAKFHILFLFFVALMFGISLISLLSYHCYLIRNNRSTLEAFRPTIFQSGADKHGFDLGALANFEQVFGNDPKYWFLPIDSSLGDGITYPVQSRHQPSSYHSMDTTQTSIINHRS